MNQKIVYYIIAFALILVSCDKNNGPVSPSANIETSQDSTVERRAFDLVNDYRESQGLNRLEWSETIAVQCRKHSEDMALKKVPVEHDGFADRVAAIQKTIPYIRAGENVAMFMGYPDPAKAALDGWLNSPPHKENMEGDYNMAGMGLVIADSTTYYFTQIFVKTK